MGSKEPINGESVMAELNIDRLFVLVSLDDESVHQVVLTDKEESWMIAALSGVTGGIKISEHELEGIKFVSGKDKNNVTEAGE